MNVTNFQATKRRVAEIKAHKVALDAEWNDIVANCQHPDSQVSQEPEETTWGYHARWIVFRCGVCGKQWTKDL